MINFNNSKVLRFFKLSNFFSSVLIFLFIPILSYSEVTQKKISLNSSQLKILSNNSFKIHIRSNRTILLIGDWPQICSKGAFVESNHSSIGLSLQIFVSNDCLDLLHVDPKTLNQLAKVSFKDLTVLGTLKDYEFIFVESLPPQLKLEINEDTYSEDSENKSTPLYSDSNNEKESDIFSQVGNDNNSNNLFNNTISYRKCIADSSFYENPNYCNGRYGFDLKAFFKINKHSTLRGTTQLDFQTNESSQSGVIGKTGVRLDFLYVD